MATDSPSYITFNNMVRKPTLLEQEMDETEGHKQFYTFVAWLALGLQNWRVTEKHAIENGGVYGSRVRKTKQYTTPATTT